MEKETTEAWLEQVKADSEMTLSFLLTQRADDSFGWGKILKNMWFPHGEERPTATGLLLVGPAGCGKHTAVHHMLHLLDALPKEYNDAGEPESPYVCVFLEGEDLLSPEEDFTACRERLTALMDHCYDRHRGLFLVLESTASLPWSRKLYRFLEQQMAYYYLYRGKASLYCGPKDQPNSQMEGEDEQMFQPFFLVLLEEEEPKLPALLRRRLQLCRMTKPDRLRREQFLKNRDLGYLHVNLDELYPGQSLADLTEGMSYAQLEDLINGLSALTADVYDPVTLEEEDVLRREQTPRQTRSELQQALWAKAEAALDRLPELLALRPAPLYEQPAAEPEQTETKNSAMDAETWANMDPEAFKQSESERLAKLPVRDLAKQYLRKDYPLERLIERE